MKAYLLSKIQRHAVIVCLILVQCTMCSTSYAQSKSTDTSSGAGVNILGDLLSGLFSNLLGGGGSGSNAGGGDLMGKLFGTLLSGLLGTQGDSTTAARSGGSNSPFPAGLLPPLPDLEKLNPQGDSALGEYAINADSTGAPK